MKKMIIAMMVVFAMIAIVINDGKAQTEADQNAALRTLTKNYDSWTKNFFPSLVKKIDTMQKEIDALRAAKPDTNNSAPAAGTTDTEARDLAQKAKNLANLAYSISLLGLSYGVSDCYLDTQGYHPSVEDVKTTMSSLKKVTPSSIDVAMTKKGYKKIVDKEVTEAMLTDYNKLAEETKTSATAAKLSEQKSKESADAATIQGETASRFATEALNAEKNAKNSAEAAGKSAETATQAATEAKESATAASESAKEATKQAGLAGEAATSALKTEMQKSGFWKEVDAKDSEGNPVLDKNTGLRLKTWQYVPDPRIDELGQATASTQRLAEAAAANSILVAKGSDEELIRNCYNVAKTGVSFATLRITIDKMEEDGWFHAKNDTVAKLKVFLTQGFQKVCKASAQDAATLATVLTAGMIDPVKPAPKAKKETKK